MGQEYNTAITTIRQSFDLRRLRIVVLGYIVRGPIGGMAWHHLQYVLGLAKLGHDVLFVEDSDDYPSCYDPVRHVVDTDPSYGLSFTAETFARVGIPNAWAYHDAHTAKWFGPARLIAGDFCRAADVVMNVSGVNPLREWTERTPVRIFIDTDPVFTQARHLKNASARAAAASHNAFFTFGEGIARGWATAPDDGFPWLATRQPIFLDAWAVTPPPADARYTTVMQWQSYKPEEYAGAWYGTKAASFPEYEDLPGSTDVTLEIALGSEDAPRDDLMRRGWQITDPMSISQTPWTYQDYIRRSRGEFTVAKHGYVVSRSGWFSERSACYLASGRPVITQETGFSEWLPTGAGVLTFSDLSGAIAALNEVERNYVYHTAAARAIVAENFESSMILSRLLIEAEQGS